MSVALMLMWTVKGQEALFVISSYANEKGLLSFTEQAAKYGVNIVFEGVEWFRPNVEIKSMTIKVRSAGKDMDPVVVNYNFLNKSSLIIYKLSSTGVELQMSADIASAKTKIWPILQVGKYAMAKDAEVHTSYGMPFSFWEMKWSGNMFREMSNYFYENLKLISVIDGDRNKEAADLFFHYFYNDTLVGSSHPINYVMLDSKVELINRDKGKPELRYYSSRPLVVQE